MFESYKKRLGWFKGQRHLATISTTTGERVTGLVRKFDDECVTIMQPGDIGTTKDVIIGMMAISTLQVAEEVGHG